LFGASGDEKKDPGKDLFSTFTSAQPGETSDRNGVWTFVFKVQDPATTLAQVDLDEAGESFSSVVQDCTTSQSMRRIERSAEFDVFFNHLFGIVICHLR
jgi:hypothetical protein